MCPPHPLPLCIESASETPIFVVQPNQIKPSRASSPAETLNIAATDSISVSHKTVSHQAAIPSSPNHNLPPTFQTGPNITPDPPNTTSSNTTTDRNPSTTQTIDLSPPPPSPSSQLAAAATATSFAINELVWGPARGHPAWPGKIMMPPDGVVAATSSDSTWVQWFGGRPHHIELVNVSALKSLSEGLDAHHRAQKDTRKWANHITNNPQKKKEEEDVYNALPNNTLTTYQNSEIIIRIETVSLFAIDYRHWWTIIFSCSPKI